MDHKKVWRSLLVILVAILIITTLFLITILLGVFEPQPWGDRVAGIQPGLFALTANSERMIPLSPPAELDDAGLRYSIRLQAALAEGEPDSGYGLRLGDADRAITLAVSPLGYVGLWETSGDKEPVYILPWQTWPHVREGTAINEIQVDVDPGPRGTIVSARINHEQLWRGQLGSISPEARLWLAGYGGPATVDFQSVEWFVDTSR